MEGNLKKSRFGFDKIFEYCMFALVFLLPIFFIPSLTISLYSAKLSLVVIVGVVALVGFLTYLLSGHLIKFPKSKFLIPIILLPIIALISSAFTGSFMKSFVGNALELGTSGSIIILVILFLISMLGTKDKQEIGAKTFYALIFSAVVVLVHLLVRAFLALSLPTSVASRIPNFLLGSSTDTAIFLGAVVIVSIAALNMLSLSKRMYYTTAIVLFSSLVFVGSIGLTPVIVTVGLFSLVYFVYTFSWKAGSNESNERKTSFYSLFVLAISVIFLISGSSLSGLLSNFFNINSIEIRPNLSTTMNMAVTSWKTNPVLGVGPNMFSELWDLHKPTEINLTQFWSTDFSFGFGFIPTMFVTIGPLGTIALLAFFVLYILTGFKAIFSSGNNKLSYVASTSFFVSLFLWVMSFIYVPNLSVLVLAFVFSGIFAGTLVDLGVSQEITVNAFKNPKTNFISVFVIVVSLVFSIAGGYFILERVFAASIYQGGDTNKAAGLVITDTYLRGLSQTAFSDIQSIVGSVSSLDKLTDTQKTSIQNSIASSVNYVNQAISWDRKNYQNWFMLGEIYEVLAQNGITDALDNAKNAYTEALNRAPTNPAIQLAFARLSELSNDAEGATNYINKAIEMKSNYTDAYYMLAQLQIAQNKIDEAIKSVEATTFIEPQNASLYFQLGLLKYNNSDFSGAIKAFSQAVSIVPEYANAKYFLGLSYYRTGDKENAVAQFEDLVKSNPDNTDVATVLKEMKDGKAIFNTTTKTQDKTSLPIKEN